MKTEAVPDLLDIVRKVQPDFEKGSSLDQLKSFLEERGLFTSAIKPASDVAIVWPDPVLLHLRTEAGGLGHYVVLLPQSDRETATVWSGLVGTTKIPTWRLAEQIDGGALLISKRPINPVSLAFPNTTDHNFRLLGWASILVATPLIGFTWVSSRRRLENGVAPDRAGSIVE